MQRESLSMASCVYAVTNVVLQWLLKVVLLVVCYTSKLTHKYSLASVTRWGQQAHYCQLALPV
jgi:hypothetical protein